MKRLINARPALFCALYLAAGILGGYAIIKTEYTLFISAVSIVLLTVILTLFFYKKAWKLVVVCAAFFVIGCGIVNIAKINNDNRFNNDGYVTVTGTISADSIENEGYWSVYLTNAYADGKKLDGTVFLFVSKTICGEDISLDYGSVLTFDCYLKGVNIFRDGVDTYAYKNGVLYRASEIGIISVESGELGLTEKIQLYIKNVFRQNMTEENAGIATALTLGDKSLLSADDKEAFRKSGTAHIFAVSGLHVGFLAGLFAFFVYKAKLDKKISFLLVTASVLFYGYIIGFPPSATRAIIMVISASLLKTLGFRADMISAMSLSAIVILVVKPLYIFDAGFLMSFGAVYGIATLTTLLSKTLFYTKLPKILKRAADCVFVTLGATIGVLPALAAFYGEVFVLSVISNTIIIPVVSVVFVLLLIGIIPIPFFSYILYLPDKIISILREITTFFSKIPYANVEINGLGFGAIALFIGLFLISPYLNISKSKKFFAGAVSVLLTVILAFLGSLPTSRQPSITIYDLYPEKTIIAVSDEEVIVFSSFRENYEFTLISEYLETVKHDKVYFVIENGENFDVEILTKTALSCGTDTVYTFNNFPNINAVNILTEYGITATYLFDSIGENLTLSRHSGIGFDGYLFDVDGKEILIIEQIYDTVFGSEKYNYDLVYIDSHFVAALDCFEGQIISPVYSENYGIKSAYREGNFTFYFVFDKMILVD